MITESMAASTAGFAFALAGVPVAERHQRPFDVDAEVTRHPGAKFGGVHVAAEGVRHQRAADLQIGGGHPEGPVHGVHRQIHVIARPAGLKTTRPGRSIELPNPHDLGERVVQHGGVAGPGERPEQRHGGGRSPVPGRLDGHEVHGQGVARLRPFDVEGAGLGVDERKLADLTHQVRFAAHPSPKAVFGGHLQHGAGLDASDRWRTTESPGVLLGRRTKLNHGDLAHRYNLQSQWPSNCTWRGPLPSELQDLMARTYGERDAARGIPATVAWLAEELGELAQAARKGTKAQQLHELSDVLAWLASLANQLGLSLDEAAARYAVGCPKCHAAPCRC
jgi:NTP pyrophosphatase (non-canonical NTP hydrolase)